MADRCDFTAKVDSEIGGKRAQCARQGTRFVQTITVGDFDATGIVARMQVRTKAGDGLTAVVALTESSGISWTSRGSSSTNAVLVLDVSAVTMAAVAPGLYVYDLEFVPGGVEANAYALMTGAFLVAPEVTV